MDDETREFYNTFVSVLAFYTANAADFPTTSPGGRNFQIFADRIPIVEASGAVRESNIDKQATASKITAYSLLRQYLRKINKTARGAAVDHPEIAVLFRMPHDNSYQKILAAAMAFHTNGTTYKDILINDFGMPDDFLTVLQSRIDALQAATAEQDTTKTAKVGATANIDAEMEEMHKALRRLRAIVPNVYEDNPAKLAEWASASHVRSAPKSGGQTGNIPPTS
jgi:hypothetical protein